MPTDTPAAKGNRVDAAEVIADHLARARYADLPDKVVAAAKASILDTLGCILAGTSGADAQPIADLAFEWGGSPRCTVISSSGKRLPPVAAVLVNGAAIHQYDFDDTHDEFTCHPTASSLVPALAMAEQVDGATGQDLILAVALANDLTSRVSKAIVGAHGHPWYRAPVVGMFGATAAAAKMLGANAAQHVEAFGLALPQIGGTYASLLHHGSSVRSIRDGLAYRNAVLAAMMAMRGIRGDPEVFEGRFGFYHAYYKGSYDRDALVGELGVHFETDRISLKPWPSARHLHTTLTALLELLEEHKLGFADVAEVICDVGRINRERCGALGPAVSKEQHIDLLSNLPFAVAAAIRHGDVSLDIYIDDAAIRDVIEVAIPKVKWRYDAAQDGASRFERGLVEVHTATGGVLRNESKVARGHPSKPMTQAQRHAKFRQCAALAKRPVPAERAERIIEQVENLERSAGLQPLLELLA
jgi:2-methylcitrate dehydratase PrpD